MSDTLSRSKQEATYIFEVAPGYGERPGQFLFNSLRHEIADTVRGTFLDPFYKEMSLRQIIEWLENHIIYDDDGRMICLFDKNEVLWEDPNYA